MPWAEGPCAFVLGRRLEPGPPGGDLEVLAGAALLCAGLVAAVLLAAGPVVGRIRGLTAQVRRSAAERYATVVDVGGDDEIAALAAAFNEAGGALREHLAALEKREETLRAFVADTTHDMATPLTVLQGHLAALKRRSEAGAPPDPATVRDALEEAHYMASLLHNLGAAAKLEAGPHEPARRPVDLGRLVERAVGRHRPIARQREVSLEFAVPERPVIAAGDETLIEQALGNVIQNAVRYNDPGGHVAVVLQAPDGGRFSLRVVDDGPGVPQAEIARLGERSYRGGAARTRHPGGLGLGLHIARDIAVRHGFDLAIRRIEPRGLEVEIAGPVGGG
jgi:signal transduction histidine kinase